MLWRIVSTERVYHNECEYFVIFHRRILGGKVSRHVERRSLSLHVLCGK